MKQPTKFDKRLQGKSRAEKRAAKSEMYENQGAESAAEFNFNKSGKGHISGQEVRHMVKQGKAGKEGFGRKDRIAAIEAAVDGGATLGRRSQKMYDRMVKKQGLADKAKAAKQKAQQQQQQSSQDQQTDEGGYLWTGLHPSQGDGGAR